METPLAVTIDNFMFSLIAKIHFLYTYVNVSSTNIETGESIDFWVYPSNSEMGLWRLAAASANFRGRTFLFKGRERVARKYRRLSEPRLFPHVSYDENYSNNQYFDYVQQTFIHIDLQNFININIDNIPRVVYKGSENHFQIHMLPFFGFFPENEYVAESPLPKEYVAEVVECINDYSRQIREEPFITLQEKIECGEISSRDSSADVNVVLREFSTEFQREYNVGEDMAVAPYQKDFEDIIQINGFIKKIQLSRKPEAIKERSETNDVQLYYLEVNLNNECDPEYEHFETIHRICSTPIHHMPFFLTVPSSTINKFGMYTKYIPSGAFICKLFDYSNVNVQCTPEEIAAGRCTSKYSYVGSRYRDLFPFNVLKARGKTRKQKRKNNTKRKRRK